MKKLKLITALLTTPLVTFAQDSPAVIIVEEEELSFEEAAAAIINEDETAEEDPQVMEEAGDTPVELEEQSEFSEDIAPLAEVPEEILQEEFIPEEPVLIKTEIPRPIEVAQDQPKDVTLKSPWSPKPKQAAPSGWRYIPAPASEAYPMEVTLKNGKKLNLSVIPHQLVPEESALIVQAVEPGYNPEHGYQQLDSVSARLQGATSTLSQAADSLDTSIEKLSLLVNSLPK